MPMPSRHIALEVCSQASSWRKDVPHWPWLTELTPECFRIFGQGPRVIYKRSVSDSCKWPDRRTADRKTSFGLSVLYFLAVCCGAEGRWFVSITGCIAVAFLLLLKGVLLFSPDETSSALASVFQESANCSELITTLRLDLTLCG